VNPVIYVIDDDAGITAAFSQLLAGRGYTVRTWSRADEALARFSADDAQLVVTDVCLPGLNGLDALAAFRTAAPRLPVIVMTGRGSVDSAIEATKRGAFDYLLKPIEPVALLETVERALEGSRLMLEEVALGDVPASPPPEAMVGLSAPMQAVYKTIGRVAPTDAGVLIRGETGTGKELVARAVYQHSLRAERAMIVVNCAAVPAALLESELFGHERGAFSGAVTRRIGRFEQADGGTIFLDEIGELPLDLQSKLLRVLQEGTFDRIGGETVRVNVRILAATNRDVESAMREGRFREDLYHRLNVVSVKLPSLRERMEDLPDLVRYFAARYAAELRREPPVFSPDALAALASHAWPGNVRELQHAVQRILIFRQSSQIREADVRDALDREPPSADHEADWQPLLAELVRSYLDRNRGEASFERFASEAERSLLRETLRRTGGNQTAAARFLGLTRSTLQAKLAKLGLREPPPEA
jgi:two-component system NtrC family response regulator/two-component system nitrogen regulation response regulator GlnG